MVAGVEIGREDISRWGYGCDQDSHVGRCLPAELLFNPDPRGLSSLKRTWTFDATIEPGRPICWIPSSSASSGSSTAASASIISSERSSWGVINNPRPTRASVGIPLQLAAASSTSPSPSPASMPPTARRRTRWAASSMPRAPTTAGSFAISLARSGAEQEHRDRHQVGAVRRASAGHRRAVPDREGERARGRSAGGSRPNGCRPRLLGMPAFHPRLGIIVRGIELGAIGNITTLWSVFGGSS